MECETSGAVFDESGVYRYLLWRKWDRSRPSVAFVLLNPSTADATADDPTIRRCIGFARGWGFGGMEVANLFAFRATTPRLLGSAIDPVGPENDRHLRELAARAEHVVVAWGNGGALFGRAAAVLPLFEGRELYCLGVTKAGAPRHPLYVRGDSELGTFGGEPMLARA